MQHSQIANQSAATKRPFDFSAMAVRLGLGSGQGFITNARRQQTPHIVDWDGLTRSNLTEPGEFEYELQRRVAWCKRYAAGDFEVEPIRSSPQELTGRRFRFKSLSLATLFKLWFETNLRR